MYLLVLILCLLYSGQDQKEPTHNQNKSSASTQSASTPTPSKQPPSTPQGQEPATPKKQTPQNNSVSWFTPEWWMVVLTGIYVVLTGAYVVFSGLTLKAILRQEQDSANKFTEEIGQLTKSANNMEKIATTIQQGNREIMRAYLTVTTNSEAIFQERRVGQPDLKFQAQPIIFNTGNTPARKVCIRISADILKVPLPDKFVFPDPKNETKDAGIVGARISYTMSGTVERFVPDIEVPAIKEGNGSALYVWGVVTYEDIFGQPHFTKFGQVITWNFNNTINGYYVPGQNDAD